MTDGHRDNSVGERKLIWDEVIGLPLCLSEENRLLAVDDNGLAYARFRLRSVMSKRGLTLRSLARKVVSNYWYDADGERTVKTSGESDQVYVNGVFSGGSTNTAKFSLYVSPYLVANQGGRYTKHIYAGSQRIVSKVGDFASYGSDPRRIGYAGANTDGLSVDYKSKAQQQVIKDNYKFFDVPYNGTDNDNYADGEGFCCNDGSMEAAVAQARKAQTRAVSRSFKDPDNYENLQFFYHPDHLGSSSFITNLDGEVVQHIEYVPFGEVFIEEHNNVWNTPYLFNAKEFDEETGMYYYGARYYDPRLSLWMSTDPLEEDYPNLFAYCFSLNNPINVEDFDGRSTHTDLDGNIIQVYKDNDKGVYSHKGSRNEILINLNKNHSSKNTSGGGIKQGETEFWDEFVNPDTRKVMTEYKIQFGKSFDPIIKRLHETSKTMSLKEIAKESSPGGLFDIKKDYPNVGGLLMGKYATSRSAGNYLAGYNASTGTIFGFSISFETFQKMSGALHIESNYANRKLGVKELGSILLTGQYDCSYPEMFKSPTWDEVPYQYRMSKLGWEKGTK